jgi:hypothetical protein
MIPAKRSDLSGKRLGTPDKWFGRQDIICIKSTAVL